MYIVMFRIPGRSLYCEEVLVNKKKRKRKKEWRVRSPMVVTYNIHRLSSPPPAPPPPMYGTSNLNLYTHIPVESNSAKFAKYGKGGCIVKFWTW